MHHVVFILLRVDEAKKQSSDVGVGDKRTEWRLGQQQTGETNQEIEKAEGLVWKNQNSNTMVPLCW